MKLAIIGFGYWGQIIFKTLETSKRKFDYLALVDINKSKIAKIRNNQIDCFNNFKKTLNKVDRVIIATGEDAHYQLVKDCLLAKKHVLVTKPLALKFKQAKKLVEIAKKNNLTLMVDNTFLFDQSFLLLKNRIKKGDIGEIKQIDSFRFSCNINRPFSNAIIDLLPHDLSIFFDLLKTKSLKIKMIRTDKLLGKQIDNAQVSLKIGKTKTNSFLSWVSPINRREMVFYGDKGVFAWQKQNAENDLILFFRYNYQKELKLKKKIKVESKGKTLLKVLDHFFESINNKKEPLTSGYKILPEIKVLENVLKEI